MRTSLSLHEGLPVARHGVSPEEAEHVVRHVQPPWPDEKGGDKLVVWGPSSRGVLLQVIFVLKTPDDLEFDTLTIEQWADLHEDDQAIYIIHAMELSPRMKRQYRRRLK